MFSVFVVWAGMSPAGEQPHLSAVNQQFLAILTVECLANECALIHSTWAQDEGDVGSGASWGLVTGGLLGMLFGEKPTLADYTSAVEPLGGKFIQSELDADDIWSMRKLIKTAA